MYPNTISPLNNLFSLNTFNSVFTKGTQCSTPEEKENTKGKKEKEQFQNLINISNLSFSVYSGDSENNYECPKSDFFNANEEKKSEKKTLKSKLHYCPIGNCKKNYKSKENLKLHIANFHENRKPYKCSFCDYTFSHRNGKDFFLKLKFFN